MKRFKFNRLERHRIGGTGDSFELSYQLPRSPSGKQYMYSPNPDAVPRLFLIGDAPEVRTIAANHQAHIRLNPGSGEVVCPYSGHTGPQEDFIHPADKDYVQKQAGHDAVSEFDLTLLMDCIQKRHVIGHNLGIADDRYLSLAHTEERHRIGESVRVLGEDIGRFAEICLSVVGDLERALLPNSEHCP